MDNSQEKTAYSMVKDFHKCMSQPEGTVLCDQTLQLFLFRVALIKEEMGELMQALDTLYKTVWRNNSIAGFNDAKEHACKELQDLKYVLEGMCVTFGWDSDEAFKRVHESNMSKLVDGKPYKDEAGKVQKGPNYAPPVLTGLLNEEKEEQWRKDNVKLTEDNKDVN